MKKPVLLTFWILLASLHAFSAANPKQLKISMQDLSTGIADQTTIYFDLGAAPTYTFPEDVSKSFDTVQSDPQIYSYSQDNIKCYSNGYGEFSATTTIPLGIRSNGNTNYLFSAAILHNFDSTSIVLLEDRATGTFTDLRTSNYNIALNQQGFIENRFFVHFSYPPTIHLLEAGCGDNDGVISIAQDSIITWSTCTLYNADGTVNYTFDHVTGNFSFTGLPGSAYNIVFNYNGYAASIPVSVGANQVQAGITASTIHAVVNQVVDFSAITVNASQFEWSFGDSTLINGIVHPEYAYSEVGTYNVSLKASNTFGCVAYAYTTVYVTLAAGVGIINGDEVKVISDNSSVRILISSVSNNNYTYEMYNIAGQMMMSGPITSPDVSLPVFNQPTGLYIIKVKSGEGSFSKKVFLSK